MTLHHPLDDVERWLRRFVAYPSEAAVIGHVLWTVHTHLVAHFENTPRLAAISPEPGSGKSRLLEATEPLVPRPIITVNASTSYVFRKIADDAGLPTLLFDEVDSIFGPRPTPAAEELRGLLNSGYRRGAVTGRAVIIGKKVETEELPSFAPVALAGLNQLPDTLMTRSVVIRMQRRRPDQQVEPYRRRVERVPAAELYESIAAWAATIAGLVEDYWPELPDEVSDRDADVWEPLITVADLAGGVWPARARRAAVALVTEAHDRPVTLGIRLLADIRTALGHDDRLSTHELLDRLHEMDDAPWSDLRGQPIDARFLAKQLTRYSIETNNTIRIQGRVVKGYTRQHFHDAWARYCPETGNSGDRGNKGAPYGPDDTAATDVTEFRSSARADVGLLPPPPQSNFDLFGEPFPTRSTR